MSTYEKLTDEILKVDLNKLGSNDFSCYRKVKQLDEILKDHCFFTKSLENQDDGIEIELHKDSNLKTIFPLCFCNSSSEKLPMWFLYGGVDFKGTRISLTSAKIRDFINEIENGNVEIYASKKENGKITYNEELKFIYNEDIVIAQYGFVHYRSNDKIRYRNKWYEFPDDVENFEKHSFLSKSYIWEYEREFRIVFKLINEKCTDEWLNEHKFKGIAVKIPDKVYKNLKIMLSPSYLTQGDSKFLEYEGISSYVMSKINLSNFKGQIKMDLKENLCEDCQNKKT